MIDRQTDRQLEESRKAGGTTQAKIKSSKTWSASARGQEKMGCMGLGQELILPSSTSSCQSALL